MVIMGRREKDDLIALSFFKYKRLLYILIDIKIGIRHQGYKFE